MAHAQSPLGANGNNPPIKKIEMVIFPGEREARLMILFDEAFGEFFDPCMMNRHDFGKDYRLEDQPKPVDAEWEQKVSFPHAT